jgi:hypothetical protein
MTDDQFILSRCLYPGCPRTVIVRRHFFCPPRGWVWIEHGDPAYEEGLFCEEHAEEIEKLL